MGIKRGGSNLGVHRNRASGGSPFPVLTLLLVLILAPFVFYIGRGIHSTNSIDETDSLISLGKHQKELQDVDWRTKLALQHVKSLFSKEVIAVIKAKTDDLGPLSLDSFRKSNFSASWKFAGQENVIDTVEIQETPKAKQDSSLDADHSQNVYVDTPTSLARRQLRDKRREDRVANLLKLDDDVTLKLENAAIERSKSVDSAVLGKYSIWRKETDNENVDTTVRLMRDQIIMARVYMSLATMKHKISMAHELQNRIKASQRALGDTTTDADLNRRYSFQTPEAWDLDRRYRALAYMRLLAIWSMQWALTQPKTPKHELKLEVKPESLIRQHAGYTRVAHLLKLPKEQDSWGISH